MRPSETGSHERALEIFVAQLWLLLLLLLLLLDRRPLGPHTSSGRLLLLPRLPRLPRLPQLARLAKGGSIVSRSSATSGSTSGQVAGPQLLLLVVQVSEAAHVVGAQLVLEHGQRLAALLVVVDDVLGEQLGRMGLSEELLEHAVDVQRLLGRASHEGVSLFVYCFRFKMESMFNN